ncbi:hypothetical protein E2C01_034712 [Portunus trituberculatus]|uniref:Uncharacterized protein n=1 Tax=Portunus trituberculatus TaxID=210409 RepID=A0A5B7F6E5_PORTR|nr:hypothetical protein [Portunus trituberculatus]
MKTLLEEADTDRLRLWTAAPRGWGSLAASGSKWSGTARRRHPPLPEAVALKLYRFVCPSASRRPGIPSPCTCGTLKAAQTCFVSLALLMVTSVGVTIPAAWRTSPFAGNSIEQ